MKRKLDETQNGRSAFTEPEQARHFASNYVEYDLSKMRDSKGGFMADEDGDAKRIENEKILRRRAELEKRKKIIFDPAPSMNPDENPKCFECQSMDIDHQLHEVFGARVCFKCKSKFADKYSLLTKTECKEDYLLTDRKF